MKVASDARWASAAGIPMVRGFLTAARADRQEFAVMAVRRRRGARHV